MKRWIARSAFVLGLPATSFGLLSLGAEMRDGFWGRLIQVAGGFLALVWLTGTFLLVGTLLSAGSGYRAADAAGAAPPATSTHRPGERKEDSES